ncbi:hypothetical protein CLAVI_000346 [Candidatus Clavichlamydia salmonicola]|uniref:hypothetical protein n=1 Tax=Candidatus Clavichlamydia salmonicola TaxID=469812 RepID=UPI001891A7F8|nr:hypothetical protein [Candidatus Clavichlamydia salmonicola]MBF5050728.1 hypothetical protein [Candidatus Clavichlamydia salmonicola]
MMNIISRSNSTSSIVEVLSARSVINTHKETGSATVFMETLPKNIKKNEAVKQGRLKSLWADACYVIKVIFIFSFLICYKIWSVFKTAIICLYRSYETLLMQAIKISAKKPHKIKRS